MTPAEKACWAVFDIFTSRDYERVRDLVTPDFVDHGAPPGVPPGPEGYMEVLRYICEVLQLEHEAHEMVASGDLVAVRTVTRGVHTTHQLGVPPTGKPYVMEAMHFYRAEGDRLAEHWGVRDEFGVLVQIGAHPAAAGRRRSGR